MRAERSDPRLRAKSEILIPHRNSLSKLHFSFNLSAFATDIESDHVVGIMSTQRLDQIMDIADLAIVPGDNRVGVLQAGLLGRTVGTDVR